MQLAVNALFYLLGVYSLDGWMAGWMDAQATSVAYQRVRRVIPLPTQLGGKGGGAGR